MITDFHPIVANHNTPTLPPNLHNILIIISFPPNNPHKNLIAHLQPHCHSQFHHRFTSLHCSFLQIIDMIFLYPLLNSF